MMLLSTNKSKYIFIFILLFAGILISVTYIVNKYSNSNNINISLNTIRNKKCKNIFEIRSLSPEMSAMTNRAASILGKAKDDKNFLRYLFYQVLGFETPSMVEQVSVGHGIEGSHLSIKEKWRFQQMDGQLPYLSCNMQYYDSSKIGKCVAKRLEKNKTTNLAFVGDSRIRQILEVSLDSARGLEMNITTHKGEMISLEDFFGEKGLQNWKKYKHKFKVVSNKVPGITMDFHWAAFLDKGEDSTDSERIGALDLLKHWNEVPTDELPDIIFMGTGAWQLIQKEESPLYQAAMTGVRVMQKIRPLLSKLALRTTVVWVLPDPYKEYMAHDFSPQGRYTQETNAVAEWILNAQAALVPPQVIKWDSILPISFAARLDCMKFIAFNINSSILPPFSHFRTQESWFCHERMHTGFESISVGVQMIWNHICNPYLPGDYCCS